MLRLVNASGGYGRGLALFDVNMEVTSGEIVGLLGPNGSGKTTLFRYIMGLLDRTEGTVLLDGEALPSYPHSRARRGIGYVPQGRLLFPRLTVEENVTCAAISCGKNAKKMLAEAFSYFPAIEGKAKVLAGTLSGGQQQMVAIARGLALEPRFLLLDEPTEGIQPSIVTEIAQVLRTMVRERNIGVILAEQNVEFCEKLASRFYVLRSGHLEIQDSAGSADRLKL